jgi:hypothetical protein
MADEDFAGADLRNENVYDSVRFSQWRAGRVVDHPVTVT